jgi:hypothetical protein
VVMVVMLASTACLGSAAPTSPPRSPTQPAPSPPASPMGCPAPPVLVTTMTDGVLRRTTVRPPVGLGRPSVISGLSALTASNIWAVGTTQPLVGTYALGGGSVTAHWDGSAWSLVSAPSRRYSNLVAVLAVSARDVWAVGASQGSIPPGVTVATTLVEHWNGQQWRIVPSPNSAGSGQLTSIASAGGGDLWAAGGAHSGGENVPDRPLVEHWDGSQWRVIHVPFGAHVGYVRDLAVESHESVWLDAYDRSGLVIKHWNGHAWLTASQVPIDRLLYPQTVIRLVNGLAVLHEHEWRLFPAGHVSVATAGVGVGWAITAQQQVRIAHQEACAANTPSP